MVWGWFNTKDVNALADRLAEDFVRKIPPTSLEGSSSSKKLSKSYGQVMRQAHAFVQTHSMNLYKKAHMANRFKWALLQAGYPKWFVDEMTYELASVVAAADKSAK